MRPGWGSRLSGTRSGASTSSGTSTGTAIRNTDPHAKCARRNPPTIGPSADPAENMEAQIAMARRRWSRSVKMLRRSERVEGMSIAPNTPMSARAAMSTAAVGAKAARAETVAKPVAPMSSIRRRPNRSPSVPIVTSRLARTSG